MFVLIKVHGYYNKYMRDSRHFFYFNNNCWELVRLISYHIKMAFLNFYYTKLIKDANMPARIHSTSTMNVRKYTPYKKLYIIIIYCSVDSALIIKHFDWLILYRQNRFIIYWKVFTDKPSPMPRALDCRIPPRYVLSFLPFILPFWFFHHKFVHFLPSFFYTQVPYFSLLYWNTIIIVYKAANWVV